MALNPLAGLLRQRLQQSPIAQALGLGDSTQPPPSAAPLPQVAGASGIPDLATREAYIRATAQELGIDPDTAMTVARSEGHAPGVWQSTASRNGRREPSYSDFQLLIGGGNTGYPEGLGNRMIADTGLDPSDPKNWQASTRYALETAKKEGWGAWYGAKAKGITGKMGIDGTPMPNKALAERQVASGQADLPVWTPNKAPFIAPTQTNTEASAIKPMDMGGQPGRSGPPQLPSAPPPAQSEPDPLTLWYTTLLQQPGPQRLDRRTVQQLREMDFGAKIQVIKSLAGRNSA